MERLYYISVLATVLALSACFYAPDKKADGPALDYGGGLVAKADAGLGFPYANPQQADFIHCFGICPWNNSSSGDADNGPTPVPATGPPCLEEKHIGIDIYPKPYSILRPFPFHTKPPAPQAVLVKMVAPADATVAQIGRGQTGRKTRSLLVALKLKRNWYVVYSFEPHSKSEEVWELQQSSLLVTEGQAVKKGEVIGSLVVTENTVVKPSLHYSFLYLEPGQSLDDLHEVLKNNIETVNVSDGTDVKAVGLPGDDRELHIPTTFFCPEAFSSLNAKKEYGRLPARDRHGVRCSSTCAYNSTNGNCGTAHN
jgi:hypothetical protein